MSKLLVIGCGGVASVAIQKCCRNSKVFTELCLASRTTAAPCNRRLSFGVDCRDQQTAEQADVLQELDALRSFCLGVGLVPERVTGDGGRHETAGQSE